MIGYPKSRMCLMAVALLAMSWCLTPSQVKAQATNGDPEPGVVHCANLIYGYGNKVKTSVCFSVKFMSEAQRVANIRTNKKFAPIRSESKELFKYPFAVLTGEGPWAFTDSQLENVREYLSHGGFIVASAGCSSKQWAKAFRSEMAKMFPEMEMKKLGANHPVFHTVFDITSSKYKSGENKLPELWGLDLDGRTVLVFSPDGLNDTDNAGTNCCCCGGNEVKAAKYINVNLLAYALTH